MEYSCSELAMLDARTAPLASARHEADSIFRRSGTIKPMAPGGQCVISLPACCAHEQVKWI